MDSLYAVLPAPFESRGSWFHRPYIFDFEGKAPNPSFRGFFPARFGWHLLYGLFPSPSFRVQALRFFLLRRWTVSAIEKQTWARSHPYARLVPSFNYCSALSELALD